MFDEVFEFARVISSQVSADNTTTLYNVTGIGAFDDEDDPDGDDAGEQAHEQEVFTALGLVGRPLPPEDDFACESLGARTSDGIVPFSYRELRLHRAINPSGDPVVPAEGQLMFVGYGGAFLSHSLTAVDSGDQKANITTLYLPYDFTDGVPAKAHAVTFDPTPGNESLALVHGGDGSDGASITLGPTGDVVIKNQVGDAYIEINSTEIILNGNVKINGGLACGTLTGGLPFALITGAPPPGTIPSVACSGT